MDVYALFNDKTSSRIVYDFHSVSSAESNRLQFESIINNEEIRFSIGMGLWSALKIYESKLQPTSENYFVYCEFENDFWNSNITGKSAGLAFSLKFASELLKRHLQKNPAINIAATGEVSSGGGDSKVKKVQNINEKFSAALNVLKSGDFLFFPLENSGDIDPELQRKISHKGIVLFPVKTVREAIEKLFQQLNIPYQNQKNPVSNYRHYLKYGLIVSVILLLFFLIWYIGFHPVDECYERLKENLEYGKFGSVKTELEKCLHKTGNVAEKNKLAELQNEIKSELKVEINFQYFQSNKADYMVNNTMQDILLGVGSGYRFEILPDRDCYLYIFQFDSNFGIELLFPLSGFSISDNYIFLHKQYFIPGGGNYFYLTDQHHHGQLTLYFLGSPWRSKDIEDAYTQFELASTEHKNNYRDEIVKRILYRAKAAEFGIKGVFFKKDTFLQE